MSPNHSPSNSNGDGKSNALAKLSQLNVSISGSGNSSPQSTPSRIQAQSNQRKSKLQCDLLKLIYQLGPTSLLLFRFFVLENLVLLTSHSQ